MLYGCPVHGRISGRRQQAFRRCQQGALAIRFKGAALKHEVHLLHRGCAEYTCVEQVSVQRIIFFRRKLSAPGVEPEIQQCRPIIGQDGNRPMVSRPGIVCWRWNGLYTAREPVLLSVEIQLLLKLLQTYHVFATYNQMLVSENGFRNIFEDRLHLFHNACPVCSRMGPGQHHGTLGSPLGGQHSFGCHYVTLNHKRRHSNQRLVERQDIRKVFPTRKVPRALSDYV